MKLGYWPVSFFTKNDFDRILLIERVGSRLLAALYGPALEVTLKKGS